MLVRQLLYSFAVLIACSSSAAFGQATPVERIRMPEGFQCELLYTVPGKTQGSWVSMTTDPKGRLIVSDQYGKLYRVSVPAVGEQAEPVIETIELEVGMAQGLLCAFDSLYVVTNEGKEGGLYRVTDTDGDDQYDHVETLRRFNGRGEHGPHAVVLSPDGKSLYVCAGNHTELPELSHSFVTPTWQEDQLLPRMWDARGHAVGKLAPGGWICRVSPDGKDFELISSGFRNEYDIAFSPEGELFTYDADMEWDVGTPWYRPTRVNHVTLGSEFGWRSGTGKWPEFYPDSLGSVVDIGVGSPTGIVFGTGAKFPAKYQKSLFISDWSYGVIYAVSMERSGASFTGKAERFSTGAPLPVTDLVVHPEDGSLYFTIGGRKVQSALYRVTYIGEESTEPVEHATSPQAGPVQVRRSLESMILANEPSAELAWRFLHHHDRHVRYAARTVIEQAPLKTWKGKFQKEAHPQAVIEAAVAMARMGEESHRELILSKLNEIDASALSKTQVLALCRAYGLTFARLGQPTEQQKAATIASVDGLFPANDQFLNQELARLFCYLEAPEVVSRTLALLAQAPSQEEQLHYALCLRVVKTGWTTEQRAAYLNWFHKGVNYAGGASFTGFLTNIRNEALENFSEDEKKALAELIAKEPKRQEQKFEERTKVVAEYKLEELHQKLTSMSYAPNFERGREMFGVANCYKCHRIGGSGGSTGPDLSGAGKRFSQHDLLEAIIDPNKEVSDQYETTTWVMEDGKVITGRVANLSGNTLRVMTDMLKPGDFTGVKVNEVMETIPNKASMMPAGLINTLTQEEVADLIAYLKAGGDSKHEVYQPQKTAGK